VSSRWASWGAYRRLYQQFAITIGISVLFLAFNALTLSPALGRPAARPASQPKARSAASWRLLPMVQPIFDAHHHYLGFAAIRPQRFLGAC